MAVERRERRPSRISQILFQPLVTMGRKISGGRKKMEEEEEDALRDPFLEQTLKIPQDFISEMKEAFRYFDKSGSGFLSAKEMPALLRALGWNPTETEVNTIMAEVDVDHNGKMDLSEFILMMHKQVGSTDTMEEMRIAFRAFDTDGDGKISKEEFRVCMLNFGERFLEEDIELMIRLADLDDNGFIDFEEFVRMLTMDELELELEGNTHARICSTPVSTPCHRRLDRSWDMARQ